MIGRQMAHMIYAFFEIYDEQGRAIGLDDLLNTKPCRRRRCAWRKARGKDLMESLCQRYLGKLTLNRRFVTRTRFIGTSLKSWTQLTALVTGVLEGQHSSLNSREVSTDQAKQPQSFLSVRGRGDGKIGDCSLEGHFFFLFPSSGRRA